MKKNFIKFLGTAGARFVMIKQLRASGGLWISYKGANVLIDPGPGSIVRCASSRPKLDPSKLDGIILTHCHLDHSGDINVMIEAMTEGGFKKRGIVFCPQDALDGDGVVFKYLRAFPERIEVLAPNKTYKVGELVFETSMLHHHRVLTYGLRFNVGGKTLGLLADTRYFKELEDFYKTDILIVGVVFAEPRPEIDHLSLPEAVSLIKNIRPKKTILTHFGMTMLKAGPYLIEGRLSKELGMEVISAYDGMSLEL